MPDTPDAPLTVMDEAKRLTPEKLLEMVQTQAKEITELKATIEKMKQGSNQLINVTNANLDALKSNLIQTLAMADNCRIVVQPAPAPKEQK